MSFSLSGVLQRSKVAVRDFDRKALNFLLVVSTVLILGAFLVRLYYVSKYFHLSPYDGVFQTLFPLEMISRGEFPGYDFFYFHGNGIPYLIYPMYSFFVALGFGKIFSVVFVSGFMSAAFLYLPIYFFLKRRFGRDLSILSILIFYIVGEAFFVFNFYNSVYFTGAPMGMRFFPHLIPLLLFSVMSEHRIIYRSLMLGVLMPLSVWVGAEQGFYASVSGIYIVMVMSISTKKVLQNVFVYLIAWVLTFIAHQYILFGGLNILEDLQIISENQVWVFGVYPNSYYNSFESFFSLMFTGGIPSLIMSFVGLIFFAWCSIKFSSSKDEYYVYIGSLYVGGVLSWFSAFGYIGQHQSSLIFRFVLIFTIYILVRLFISFSEGNGSVLQIFSKRS